MPVRLYTPTHFRRFRGGTCDGCRRPALNVSGAPFYAGRCSDPAGLAIVNAGRFDSELNVVDLHLESVGPANPREVSVRIEGIGAEFAENVVLRVVDRLKRHWNTELRGDPSSLRPMPVGKGVASGDVPIDVSLNGTFSGSARKQIEDDIRDTVAAARTDGDGGGGNGAGGSGPVQVCMSAIPGDLIGERTRLADGTFLGEGRILWRAGNGSPVWVDPPGGGTSWTVLARLDSAPFNYARLIIEDGTRHDPPVPSGQVLVGLANQTDWAKEIWTFNLCSGRLGSVYQEGTNPTARTMLLSRPSGREGADTIVFRKPGFSVYGTTLATSPQPISGAPSMARLRPLLGLSTEAVSLADHRHMATPPLFGRVRGGRCHDQMPAMFR